MKGKGGVQRMMYLLLITGAVSINSNCKKGSGGNGGDPPDPVVPTITLENWVTRGDQTALIEKQSNLVSGTVTAGMPTIDVDSASKFQTMDGFGFALTGSSAYVINKLPAPQKASLLQELFGTAANSISVSYLRISIGASDLSPEVFSYNDLPTGQTDPTLAQFSLSKDTVDLIPLLKEILLINPSIKIMASPWSAPVWMKDNGSSIGGSLQTQYYSVYAQYFVKYLQAMKAKGITIDAITVQNEPQHGGNNPSMVMSAGQQGDFVKNHLGPAFQAAGVTAKIIIWDHNCDNPNYPITILSDPAAKAYIDGTAFHLYGGDISALSTVKNAHPDKNLYFTEQWTGANGTFSGDLQWHVKNVVVGSARNHAKAIIEWNLASDPNYDPHTPGGCSECKGAITATTTNYSRNVSYYIIAHASKFVPMGSVRIGSNDAGGIFSAAFVRPDGKKVLVAVNDNASTTTFVIKYKGSTVLATLTKGAVGTYVWN